MELFPKTLSKVILKKIYWLRNIMRDLKIKNKEPLPEKISLEGRRVIAERFTFNFSFITNKKEYDIKHCEPRVKKKLLEKLEFLSSKDKVAIMGLSKEQTFEIIPEKEVSISPHTDFVSSGRADKAQDGYYVFRLNKLGRVIGKVIDNTFYITAVDTNFDLYDH